MWDWYWALPTYEFILITVACSITVISAGIGAVFALAKLVTTSIDGAHPPYCTCIACENRRSRALERRAKEVQDAFWEQPKKRFALNEAPFRKYSTRELRQVPHATVLSFEKSRHAWAEYEVLDYDERPHGWLITLQNTNNSALVEVLILTGNLDLPLWRIVGRH